MPRRRSSRLKGKAQDVEVSNVETELVKDIASKTKDVQSVSNNNKKLVIEEVEQKDPSEPQSMEQTPDPTLEQQQQPITAEPQTDNKDANEQDEDDEDMEQEEHEDEEEEQQEVHQTLIAGRSRRNVAPKSYKDDSSSEEDEDEDPMYAGLSKEQRQAMKEKMAEMQKGCNDATLKERALKIQEIIGSFELNIDADVTEEEAAFIYDFSRKHQFDVIEKIEDEGDFFLDSMREMIEEKMKLHQAGIRTNGGKRKRRKDEDSESEFDMNDFEDSDSDSEYSLDSDFENPFEDNENMIDEYEDEEDYAAWGDKKRRRGGKRRRNKNIYKVDGREYYAKGRLLLTDALKDTENFEGWSAARVKAWKNKEVNPNAYHYRFNLPGEEAVNGGLRDCEIKPFMERVKELGVNVHWGTFSAVIKGRVGYQCSNYWRQFMKDGWVKDPNYWILPDGKFQFKRGKNKDIPESIRRYSFVVLKDPSGTFGPDFPAFHPKRPSDAQLKKWLETDVRDLDDSVKAGKKGKKKSRARGKGKKKNDEKEDDNETKDNKEEEEATNDDKNDSETTDNKETKKSKKKGSKKKKDKKKKNKKKDKKDGEDDNDENEENDETKDKKTKKKTSKKSKKSSKKDKKKKDKKSKSKKKSSKKKNGKKEEEGNDNDNDEKEDNSAEQETASKSKRGKKRKHSESAGDESSELEPPQKKRKKMNKSKKSKKEDKNKKEMNVDSEKENEEESEDALSKVLGDMVDIMTGDKLVDPAISPYGYVMSYNSWCSILRNSKTKNKCPFTKQKLTRRSLIKLTVDNIGEYEDQIVNVTEEERKNFML